MVMGSYHVLAFFDELYSADATMAWHLNLFYELHFSHIPEIYQPIVISTGKYAI